MLQGDFIKRYWKLLGQLSVHQLLKEEMFHAVYTFNHLTPNGHYMGRTAQLTSRCCILYIYSANIRTEHFKHAA